MSTSRDSDNPLDQLILQLRAVLRAAEDLAASPIEFVDEGHRSGDISLVWRTDGEVATLMVSGRRRRVELDGKEVPLRKQQFDLLYIMASNPDLVLSFQRLEDILWPNGEAGSRRQITTLVWYLNQYLRGPGVPRPLIESLPGVGYRLKKPSESDAA